MKGKELGDVNTDRKLTISEAVVVLERKGYSVTPQMLRQYEQYGLVKPDRKESGYRLYSDTDIFRIRSILGMLTIGFSKKEIKEFFGYYDYIREKSKKLEKTSYKFSKQDMQILQNYVDYTLVFNEKMDRTRRAFDDIRKFFEVHLDFFEKTRDMVRTIRNKRSERK